MVDPSKYVMCVTSLYLDFLVFSKTYFVAKEGDTMCLILKTGSL